MSNKTILVSGASGFLGKELVQQLLEENYRTIALTSKPKELIKYFGNQSKFIALNINNWTKKIDKNIDIHLFINCAFPRSSKPDQLAEGLDFTEKIIKDAINLGIKNIVNISSQSVYSQKDKSTPDENSEVAPESLYGMAKYASERIVTVLCENSGKINYSNIRLASLTGNELEARMTNKFVKIAINGGTITVNGKGQKVSYLEVRDAASALIAMINKDPDTWKTIYNLGNHHYYSVLDIVETINEVAKKYSVPGINIDLKNKKDDFNNLINSELFYLDFNWKPKYDINLMVENLFDFYVSKNKLVK